MGSVNIHFTYQATVEGENIGCVFEEEVSFPGTFEL